MKDNFGYVSLMLPIRYKDTSQYYYYKGEKRIMQVSFIDYANGTISFSYAIPLKQLALMEIELNENTEVNNENS